MPKEYRPKEDIALTATALEAVRVSERWRGEKNSHQVVTAESCIPLALDCRLWFVRQRAKVPSLLIHDLRRTAVRNMIRAGIPEKQAMRISGHKSRSIFDRYDITDGRDIQLAGQKLARYLEEKASSDSLSPGASCPKKGASIVSVI